MYKNVLFLSLLASSSVFAGSDLDALKAQLIQQQKITQQLLQKVETLEKQSLQNELSQKNEKLATRVEALEDVALNTKGTSSSFSQNAYLPDMAFVLNMSAVGRNVNNTEYTNFEIPGFINSGNAVLPFNQQRGFNFNYAEVSLHSTVDPYFDAFVLFHIAVNSLEIEEGYVTTTALPSGLQVKAGKFRSDFGRLNAKHQHSWNFDEQALIYKAMLGPDGINDAGVQLQWVAPTDPYLMLGAEAMQGTNPRSFGDTEENNLYVGYAKSSIDIGEEISLLGGLSIAHGKTASKNDSTLYGADFTLRDQLGSYSSLVWQSEYMYRNQDTNNTLIPTNKQAGFYTQLVYQHNKNYSGGIRYDKITKNEIDLSSYGTSDRDNLDRFTGMLEYKPFPFSRLRLEYSHDRSKFINKERKDINTVMMTLNIAAGAHSAHAY